MNLHTESLSLTLMLSLSLIDEELGGCPKFLFYILILGMGWRLTIWEGQTEWID